MDQFSIRDIGNLCGIKAHTLRVWEQRYGFFIPQRQSGNHRIYSSEDLKNLLRIASLYNSGVKISRIAQMNTAEIDQELKDLVPPPGNYQKQIHDLMVASIDFDEKTFIKISRPLLEEFGLEFCIENVFYPFLQRIGMLWLSNHVIPAQEHFSSHLIRNIIIAETDKLGPVTDADRKVLLFGLCGEYHEIPMLVARYHLRKKRVPVIYAGLNTSREIIDHCLQKHPIEYIYSHLLTWIPSEKVNETIDYICRKYTNKRVVISGPAHGCIEGKYPNLTLLDSYADVVSFINSVSV